MTTQSFDEQKENIVAYVRIGILPAGMQPDGLINLLNEMDETSKLDLKKSLRDIQNELIDLPPMSSYWFRLGEYVPQACLRAFIIGSIASTCSFAKDMSVNSALKTGIIAGLTTFTVSMGYDIAFASAKRKNNIFDRSNSILRHLNGVYEKEFRIQFA